MTTFLLFRPACNSEADDPGLQARLAGYNGVETCAVAAQKVYERMPREANSLDTLDTVKDRIGRVLSRIHGTDSYAQHLSAPNIL